jgi:hypothetical protein
LFVDPQFDAKRKLLAMRTIPILLISLGLFLTGCTLEPEKRPDLHAEVCTEACVTNADCKDNPAGSICSGGACTACLKDADCDPGLRCVVDYGICSECASDAHCKGNPAGIRCGGDFTCTCSTNADCKDPGLGLCRAEGCVCSDNTACAGQGPEICRDGACLACSTDEHCAPDADPETEDPPPHCEADSGQCAVCTTNAHCTGAENVCIGAGSPAAVCGCDAKTNCGAGRTCVNPGKAGSFCGCTTDAACADDPAGSICAKEAGTCVPCSDKVKCTGGLKCFGSGGGAFCGCQTDAHCKDDPGGPACNKDTGTCQQCVTGAHCTAQKAGSICLEDGTCSCKSDGECGGTHSEGGESLEWVCE